MVKKLVIYICVFVSTVCFIGFLPMGAGTAASLVALAIAYLAPTETFLYLAAVLVCSAISVPFIYAAERYSGVEDDPVIVIDEFIGCFLAVALLPHNLKYFIAAFFLFRFFDIFKPGPIRASQKLPRGIGVIADDFLAGLITNLILQTCALVGRLY